MKPLKGKPTKPGWYWVAYPNDDLPDYTEIRLVSHAGNPLDLVAWEAGNDWYDIVSDLPSHWHWYGPLKPPQPRKRFAISRRTESVKLRMGVAAS